MRLRDRKGIWFFPPNVFGHVILTLVLYTVFYFSGEKGVTDSEGWVILGYLVYTSITDKLDNQEKAITLLEKKGE